MCESPSLPPGVPSGPWESSGEEAPPTGYCLECLTSVPFNTVSGVQLELSECSLSE